MKTIGGNKISTNCLDWTLNAVYSTKSDSYARLARQVMCPSLDALKWAKVSAQFVISYDTDLLVTGEVELFDFTDFAPVSGSQESLPTVLDWTPFTSKVYDLTPGHAYSLRMKRTLGAGNNFVYLESASLIIK